MLWLLAGTLSPNDLSGQYMRQTLTSKLMASLLSILPGHKIEEITKLPGRHSNEVYRIVLDLPRSAVVLKLYHGEDALSRANAEASALLSLESEPILTPRLLSHGESLSSAFGTPYTLQTWIPGDRADVVLQTGTQELRNTVGQLVGQIARLIHSIKFQQYGSLSPSGPRFVTWLDFLLHNLDAGLAFCQRQNVIDSSYAKRCRNYVMERLELIESPSPSFVHGDLVPVNVLLTLDKTGKLTAGIYDFEWSSAADPYWEFAQIQRTFFQIPGVKQPFLEEYFQYHSIPADFHQRLALYHILEGVQFCSWALLDPALRGEVKQAIESIQATITKAGTGSNE